MLHHCLLKSHLCEFDILCFSCFLLLHSTVCSPSADIQHFNSLKYLGEYGQLLLGIASPVSSIIKWLNTNTHTTNTGKP